MSRRRLLLRQVAAGAFVPTDIAGCTLWLDADDASTFTYSSGTVVSEWADKSGNGHDMEQTDVANQPSRNSTINGVDAVTFDGTNDHLGRSSTLLQDGTTGEFSAFAVAFFSSVTGVRNILDGDIQGGSNRKPQYIRHSSTTAQSITFRSTTAYTDSGNVTLAISTAYRLSVIATTTALEIFVGSSSNGSTSTGSGNLNTGAATTRVGASLNNNQYFNGRIGEVIAYNSPLSAGDRASVESYLDTKWGL